MNEITEKRWVNIKHVADKPKTRVWMVEAKEHAYPSGQIKWFSRWRKYAFFPRPDTVYEPDCLKDIASFILDEMLKRKEAKLV